MSWFGAVGSLIVVSDWVCWSAQIFLIGAAFTFAHARTIGSMRDLPAERPVAAGERAAGVVMASAKAIRRPTELAASARRLLPLQRCGLPRPPAPAATGLGRRRR
ncbi:hypothetical protein [Ideonella sp. A 288]|uniref:hypothetical protein n=1 Tax=Ideonella sp. A 288 TaxID=1962181 RepID=UPI000B4BDACD|nr:hypothetical protein [Ideonella sp. A 288]